MKIVIPHHIDRALRYVTKQFKDEFSLFGKTRIVGELVYIDEVRVPKQTSTSSTTDAEQGDFLEELLDSGEDPNEIANWNMWIHSHNTMGAFWSGTDTTQMQGFNNGYTQHFFHMVMSSRTDKERLACYTSYKPFNLKVDNVPIEVTEDEGDEELMLILTRLEEIEEEKKKLEEELKTKREVLPALATELEAELKVKNSVPAVIPFNNHKHTHDDDTQYGDNWYDRNNTWSKKKMKKFMKRNKYLGGTVNRPQGTIFPVEADYDIYSLKDRNIRINVLEAKTKMCSSLCFCDLCKEYEHLMGLRAVGNMMLSVEEYTAYVMNEHPSKCECKQCASGRHIIALRALLHNTKK